MPRTAEVIFVGDAASIIREAARGDSAVNTAAKGIAASNDLIAKSYGEAMAAANAAADQASANAARYGASMAEQAREAEAAAVATMGSYGEMDAAAKAAGEAAAKAAASIGGSLADQQSAYAKAADAAKAASDVEIKAAEEAAAAQAAAAKKAAEAAVAAHNKQIAKANEAGAAMASIGGKALIGAGVLAAGSTAMAADFQSKMTLLTTQAKVPERQVAKLQEGILNMRVGDGPNKLAEGMYHVASSLNATLAPAERERMELLALETAAKGAQIGHSDLVDTTNALDAAIVSGIPGLGTYTQAMGTLNAIVGAGDMKMQDLAEALGTGLLAPMKNYGVEIQEVGGALAVFGDNNLRGAEAATKLKSAIRIMAAPSKAAGEELESVGIKATQLGEDIRHKGLIFALEDLEAHLHASGKTSTEQMRVVAKAFGGRQSEGIQILIGQLDRMKAKTREVESGTHNFGGAWQKRTENLTYQTEELKAETEQLADKVGLALIPKLEEAAGTTADVVKWFEKNTVAAKVLGGAIATVLGAAVGAFVATKAVAFVNGIKMMVAVTAALGTKMLTTVGLMQAAEADMVAGAEGAAVGVDAALMGTGIGATVVALGVAAVALQGHWDEVMEGLGEGAEDAANFVIDRLNEIIHGINELTGKLTLGLAPAIGEIKHLAEESEESGGILPDEREARKGEHFTPKEERENEEEGGPTERSIQSLKNLHLGGQVAAGIVKALMAETNRDLEKGAKEEGSEGAYGVAQWLGSRRAGLEAYAKSRHKDKGNLEIQLEYLAKELEGPEKRTLEALRKAHGVNEASAIFIKMFERPAAPSGVEKRAHEYSVGNVSGAPIGAARERAERAAQRRESYVDPFREAHGLHRGRTDMGIDFSMSPGSGIDAIGTGIVTAIVKNWYKGQPLLEYELTKGAEKGKHIYVAEQINPGVSVGQHIRAGQRIATYASSGTGVEMGFGAGHGQTLAQGTTGYKEGEVTVAGQQFAKFLSSVGKPGSAVSVLGAQFEAEARAQLKKQTEDKKHGEAEINRLTTAIQTGSVKSLTAALDSAHTKALNKTEAALSSDHVSALSKLNHELVETHASALHALDVALVREWNSAVKELAAKVEGAIEKATAAWQRAQEKATAEKYNAGLEAIEKGPNASGIRQEEKEEYAEHQKREESELNKRLKEAKWTGNKTEIEKAEEALRQFKRQQDIHARKEKEEEERKALDDGKTAEEKSLEERTNAYKKSLEDQIHALEKQLETGRISVEQFLTNVDAALASAGPGITITIGAALGKTITSGSSSEAPVIVSEHSQPTSHASGGPVYPGVTYEVGETGPERFTPSTAGSITPASRTPQGSGNVHVYGDMVVNHRRDADRFAHKLAHRLRFGGR